jgi:hypothetical protein
LEPFGWEIWKHVLLEREGKLQSCGDIFLGVWAMQKIHFKVIMCYLMLKTGARCFY